MISTCVRNNCDNIFRHDSRTMQITCSKYCRTITRGSNNLERKPKRAERLLKEYASITRVSEILKLKKSGIGTKEIFKASFDKIKAWRRGKK